MANPEGFLGSQNSLHSCRVGQRSHAAWSSNVKKNHQTIVKVDRSYSKCTWQSVIFLNGFSYEHLLRNSVWSMLCHNVNSQRPCPFSKKSIPFNFQKNLATTRIFISWCVGLPLQSTRKNAKLLKKTCEKRSNNLWYASGNISYLYSLRVKFVLSGVD